MRGILVKPQIRQLRPGPLDLLEAPEPVLLALGLDGGVGLQFFLVRFDRRSEAGCQHGAPIVVVLLENINEPKPGGCPAIRLETLANELAIGFDSCEKYAAADALQQVWHLGKRAPFAVL
jgi:hypothetical protein